MRTRLFLTALLASTTLALQNAPRQATDATDATAAEPTGQANDTFTSDAVTENSTPDITFSDEPTPTAGVGGGTAGAGAPTLPASIQSILETAIPSSILTDIAAQSALESSLLAGQFPTWLPSEVLSYFSGVVTSAQGATAVATGGLTTGAPTANLTRTAVKTSVVRTSSSASATLAATSTSATKNLASKPTGLVAAGLAGVVGVLGVAAML